MTKKPQPMEDNEFRDLQTIIINSGQAFRFTKPRYRFFITIDTRPFSGLSTSMVFILDIDSQMMGVFASKIHWFGFPKDTPKIHCIL